MKWINADVARDIFEPLVIKVHDAELTSAFTHTLILRSNVPSIDIVFCKECKFWKKINNCMSKRSTGYCDEGKRREP